MNAQRLIFTATAAATLAVAAACGGTSGTAALSKPAYIKRADAICLRASRAENALGQPSSGPQRVAYVRKVYSIERGVVQRLRTLQAPSADAATVKTMLDNVDRALSFEGDVESAAMGGNQSSINSAEAKGAVFLDRATVAATKFGFKECGNT
jgi:hypothetical protein